MPYYNKDPKRDHNFGNHPCILPQIIIVIPNIETLHSTILVLWTLWELVMLPDQLCRHHVGTQILRPKPAGWISGVWFATFDSEETWEFPKIGDPYIVH